jgi:hypothetical protein
MKNRVLIGSTVALAGILAHVDNHTISV